MKTGNTNNISMTADNSELREYYNYLLSTETIPYHDSYDNTSVSSENRATCIGWISSMCSDLKLENLVLHNSVNIFDRFLSVQDITTNNLQLAAAASTFIASKYEEIYPAKSRHFVFAMDGAGSKKDLLEMEMRILKEIDFSVGSPSANTFLSIFGSILCSDQKSVYLAMYYLELSLLTTASLQFSHSSLAAASIALARIVFDFVEPWPTYIIQFSNFAIEDLQECILFLSSLVFATVDFPQTDITKEKYGYWKFQSVSQLGQPKNLEKILEKLIDEKMNRLEIED